LGEGDGWDPEDDQDGQEEPTTLPSRRRRRHVASVSTMPGAVKTR
jgi:hypothetical protein